MIEIRKWKHRVLECFALRNCAIVLNKIEMPIKHELRFLASQSFIDPFASVAAATQFVYCILISLLFLTLMHSIA